MPKQKIKILYIHGGMTFKSNKDYLRFLKIREISLEGKTRWSGEYLEKRLGRGFQIIKPRMPLSDNARYEEWKIHLERYLSQLKNRLILIGESLGGVFLAKYLSENKLSQKALSVYLVCPPFDNSLRGEDLVGGFRLKSDLSLLEENCQNLYLLFSSEDTVIPASHAEKYRQKLPNAKIKILKNIKGHFEVEKFPEIVRMIKKDIIRK